MTATKLHILFSGSAAGSLRQVVDVEGAGDEVVALNDPLSLGRIRSLEPDDRLESLVRTGLVDRAQWAWLPEDSGRFWSRCAEAEVPRLVWVSPRQSDEAAGFHAYLHRFGHIPCEVVDLGEAEHRLRHPDGKSYGPVVSLGELPARLLGILRDFARPLAADEAGARRGRWEHLTEENAMLRVAGDEGLRSAPETLIDEALLALCSPEWRRTARVLGELLVAVPETHGFTINDMFLEWRIDTLLSCGILESREESDGQANRFSGKAWIRIPPPA